MKQLPSCSAEGCSDFADPRWFMHDRDGKIVPACDGHGRAPDGPLACASDPCTCPPAKLDLR